MNDMEYDDTINNNINKYQTYNKSEKGKHRYRTYYYNHSSPRPFTHQVVFNNNTTDNRIVLFHLITPSSNSISQPLQSINHTRPIGITPRPLEHKVCNSVSNKMYAWGYCCAHNIVQ